MGLAEKRAEKKRKELLAVLKKHGYSLVSDKSGEEIYAKNDDHQFIFGKDGMIYDSGSIHHGMKYVQEAEEFLNGYYLQPPPTFLEVWFDTLKKSAEYLSKKSASYLSCLCKRAA
jgi:hypothetical protein